MTDIDVQIVWLWFTFSASYLLWSLVTVDAAIVKGRAQLTNSKLRKVSISIAMCASINLNTFFTITVKNTTKNASAFTGVLSRYASSAVRFWVTKQAAGISRIAWLATAVCFEVIWWSAVVTFFRITIYAFGVLRGARSAIFCWWVIVIGRLAVGADMLSLTADTVSIKGFAR